LFILLENFAIVFPEQNNDDLKRRKTRLFEWCNTPRIIGTLWLTTYDQTSGGV
jgi:hypothetical protein